MPLHLQKSRLFAAIVLLCCIAPPALAQRVSARDKAAAEVLVQQMAAAESRYRQAVVLVANGDPKGTAESNAALEDMEDAVDACARQRGCPLSDLLATFKRLLKAGVDARTADLEEDPGDEGLLEADPALAADVPEAMRAARLLGDDSRHGFDRMVRFNPAIQAGIRRWLTDMRPQLMTSYENYQAMRHLMWPEFERRGLPEALLFGILAKESNGRVHSVSRAGAGGPMQFMPATGRRFGLGPDGTGFDTRYDPRSAAEASATYLNERLRELNDDMELSLAGYNGGEGRALRVHRSSGGTGFWNASVYDQFPAETRDYVPMVIAAAWIFLHPRQYGVSFPKVDAQPAPLKLSRPASIYELTVCLGNTGNRDGYMRTLRNLNPRYEAETWIPAGTVLAATTRIAGLYHRHCESGARAELAHALVTADVNAAIVRDGPAGSVAVGEVTPLPGVATTIATEQPRPAAPKAQQARGYRVAAGDTLGRIAQRHGCELKTLARANGLKAPGYAVRQGQQLRLEGCRR
ncbi:lytic transglycosylase [Pseudoxanthomonas broegbernensis]|uniref:Lytic transglycosylase n=1 Tax=Pseudoxanthomonas broegbernensis TaxID=83619 RepID=A0A7V8GPM6_9GAMM|nr:transglycosylase SLT domain-containing protein [Pseudoxanthomonas broegbernensis]KAF1687805.1 lytic transglycosylase [Pseudoxanthomonas broegbernensis]MBB6064696.1 membrane-bound lytic murein transglycosylase D [Pseudoxanthomonas broegbernensis]